MTTLPVHRDPGLIVTEHAMQYRPPGGPMDCIVCGTRQTWWLPPSRYLSRRPPPTAPRQPDPTALPDRPDVPPEPVLWSPPPGWSLVQCRMCAATLFLTLRRMPSIGVFNPPALVEVSTVRLNFSTVQYRLPDAIQDGAERWRLAFVRRQHSRSSLDLLVVLDASDPEYHAAIVDGLQMVQVRIPDAGGSERWRNAVVSGRGENDALNLTLHYDAADPEAQQRGWKRLPDAIRGEGVGQWRYPPLAFAVHHAVERAASGQRIGQWLPVNNT